MKIKSSTFSLALALGLTAILCACSPDYQTDFERQLLEVSHKDRTSITFPIEGGQKEVNVKTNVSTNDWTASSNADWVTVVKNDGKVLISAPAYNGYVKRQALVTVAYGHQEYNIQVSQMGHQSNLDIPSTGGFFHRKEGIYVTVGSKVSQMIVPLETNLTVDHVIVPDSISWVSFDASQQINTNADGFKEIKFDLQENTTTNDRYCTVTLQSSQNYDVITEFIIVQSKKGYTVIPAYGDISAQVSDLGDNLRIPFDHPLTSGAYTAQVESSAQNWLHSISITGQEVYLKVDPNIIEQPRSGKIICASQNDPSQMFTITVNQAKFIPVPPVNVKNAAAVSANGSIQLNWNTPENVNYSRLVITCYNKTLGTVVTQEINNLSTLSATFAPTYQFAGDYVFTIKSYGITGLETKEPVTLTSVSGPFSEFARVKLTTDMLTANATQSGDGQGLPGLVDDNKNTYYHTAWSYSVDKPHYVQIALPNLSSNEFYFDYIGRNGGDGGGDVKRVRIYGSSSGADNDAAWDNLGEITYTLPSGRGQLGAAKNHIISSTAYKYLRFVPSARRSKDPLVGGDSNQWWNMADLYYYELHDEAWAKNHLLP